MTHFKSSLEQASRVGFVQGGTHEGEMAIGRGKRIHLQTLDCIFLQTLKCARYALLQVATLEFFWNDNSILVVCVGNAAVL